ncbi:YgdI/YgdR family lipoprotein [Bordetella sp. 2513F-2]
MSLKTVTLAAVIAATGALAGCSSPSVVSGRDGSQTLTSDRPEYNEDTGFYEYEKDGRTVRVNKDDVRSIEDIED